MQTDALPVITRRGVELRYVTKHFRDLRGMRTAPLWAGLLLLSVWNASVRFSRGNSLDVAICIFAIALIFWFLWGNVWYKRRYGIVEGRTPEIFQPKPLSILDSNPPPRRRVWGPWWVLLGVWVIFVGTGLFRGLSIYRSSLNLWIALWLTLPRCFYSVPANGLIQLRRALYIAGSATIFFAVLGVPFVPILHSSRWLLLEIVCATLLILSLYDHWLLNRLLTGARGGGI